MKKIAVPILCILVLAAIPLVGSQAQPDLVISNVWGTKQYYLGTTTVTATVSNNGNANAGTFWVKLTVSTQGVGQGTTSSSRYACVTSLNAGNSTIVSRTFNGTNWSSYSATADCYNAVSESNESNNSKGGSSWMWRIKYGEIYDFELAVGNITLYPAEITLEVFYEPPGVSVELEDVTFYLGPEEVVVTVMRVYIEPGCAGGEIIINGNYDDGYTVTPATIELIVEE